MAVLVNAANTLSISVSSSTNVPTLNGYGVIAPGTITRTSTTLVSSFTNRRNDPDENGNVWWRSTYRFSFPAVPGDVLATFRQASATVGGNPISIAMLQGPSGAEAAIQVDLSEESFDVVWEFTEYVAAEMTGVVAANVRDGSDILLDSTEHYWTLRPANFDNSDNNAMGWMPVSGRDLPGMSIATNRVKVGVGTIGFVDTEPSFAEYFQPESLSGTAVPIGITSRSVSATLGFDSTTTDEVIDCAQFMLGHTEWQVVFDPPIVKKSRHRFNLTITVSVNDLYGISTLARAGEES